MDLAGMLAYWLCGTCCFCILRTGVQIGLSLLGMEDVYHALVFMCQRPHNAFKAMHTPNPGCEQPVVNQPQFSVLTVEHAALARSMQAVRVGAGLAGACPEFAPYTSSGC